MKYNKTLRRLRRIALRIAAGPGRSTALRDQRGMTLLEIMIVLAILALVMGFLIGPRVMEMFSESKTKLAEMQVDQLADSAYAQWSVNNPDENCPSSVSDLQKYTNNPKKEIKDPWGQELIMACGDSAPDGVPFGVTSKGPDKKEGSEDDIKSWE